MVTCVNQKNIYYLNDFKNFLRSIGVKYWRLFVIDPIGRARDHDELFLNKEQLHTLLRFIASERGRGEVKVSFGCDGFFGGYERKVRNVFFLSCRDTCSFGTCQWGYWSMPKHSPGLCSRKHLYR